MSGLQSDLGLGGQRATSSVINAFSSGGSSVNGLTTGNSVGARAVLSGALSANTLATLLNITSGSGKVPLLALAAVDAASARTGRLKVTVDGVVVFDATSSALAGSGLGLYAAGCFSSAAVFTPSEPIEFNQSFKVEVASSVPETDKLQLLYMLNRT